MSRFQAIDDSQLIQRAIAVAGDTAAVRMLKGKSGATIYQVRTSEQVMLADGTYGNPMIWLRNANDGAHALLVHSGVFRIVCANGLVIGEGYAQRVIHVAGPKLNGFLESFDQAVADGLERARDIEQVSQELSSMPLTENQALSIIGSLGIPKAAKESAINAVTLDGARPEDDTTNVWGLYQVINESNRTRSRSQLAAGYREFTLLDDIRALYSDVVQQQAA